VVVPSAAKIAPIKFSFPLNVVEAMKNGQWFGKANKLSWEYDQWELVGEVERTTSKTQVIDPLELFSKGSSARAVVPTSFYSGALNKAGQVLRQRRSGLDFEPDKTLTREKFVIMLSRIVPHLNSIPFDCLPWSVSIHIGLIVWGVQDFEPGLYILIRDQTSDTITKDLGNKWESVADLPFGLNLYFLQSVDRETLRQYARDSTCGQDVAKNGCFTLAMFGELDQLLESQGPHAYRRLMWECGMIGQVLYVEAEAQGFRSTGLGCYLDDAFRDLFGIQAKNYHSFYYFTMGFPIEDPRLSLLA